MYNIAHKNIIILHSFYPLIFPCDERRYTHTKQFGSIK